ncbi:MAG TPA: hypothetical protein VFZ33_05680 [Chitinophagaceae bacterium]
MRISFLFVFAIGATFAQGQSPCEKVKLYDQLWVTTDKPIFQKLKPFDKKLIPDSILLKIRDEIVERTSKEFFSRLKIKAIKLYDSAVAKSRMTGPVLDQESNPVFFFYAVLFETMLNNEIPFQFRLDFLKNGELLDIHQILGFKREKLDIIECEKIMGLVYKDTIQPIRSIQQMSLVYSSKDEEIIWTVVADVDPKTKIQYVKEISAYSGDIVRRSFIDLNKTEKLEEIKAQ